MEIEVRYGFGFGTYTDELSVDADTQPHEIEAMVEEHVMERIWWSWKVVAG